jgi:hypothetical protein
MSNAPDGARARRCRGGSKGFFKLIRDFMVNGFITSTGHDFVVVAPVPGETAGEHRF